VQKHVEETSYRCPVCGDIIEKVVFNFGTHKWHRWTCRKCGRDYGYNTEKPLL